MYFIMWQEEKKPYFFIVQGFDLYLALKASTSSTLYLEEGLCVLLLLSACICIFLVCFAVSLKYQALPGEEHENMFSVQKDSKSLHAGEKISCQINWNCEHLPFRAWLHMVHPSVWYL